MDPASVNAGSSGNSGAPPAHPSAAAGTAQAPSGADAAVAGSPAAGEATSVVPLRPASVLFRDPESSFATADVYDADREVVRFDAERQVMVSMATGNSVAGWTTTDNDLRWQQSSVAFRVRFGTEGGERRAYFTEAGNGTICNLQIAGPGALSISGTSQLPPQ